MKDARITVRVTEQEKEVLSRIAAIKDIPVSQIIREAIKEFIKEDNSGSGNCK